MKNITHAFVFGALLLFSACKAQVEEAGQPTPEENPTYAATGLVTEINESEKTLSIDHEEIKGLMPEMEMEFPFPENSPVEPNLVGRMIAFTMEKEGDEYRVSDLKVSAELNPKEKYLENCARCHGEFGEGRLKGIPFIKGHALSHSEEEFIETVTNGKKKMPSFRDELSDREIKWIVRYVRKVIQRGLSPSEKHIH